MRDFKSILYLFVLLGTLFFLGCEEYVGYQFEGDLNKEKVRISGTITSRFTGDSLDQVFVRFGDVTAFTDQKGHFSLVYELGQDEVRNKPVSIVVSKRNYLPFQKEIILFPPEATFNVRLSYGAPIIDASAFFPYKNTSLEEKWVLQAGVFDYQGWQDIREVKATFFYTNLHDGSRQSVEKEMHFIKPKDENTGYYQTIVAQFLYRYGEKEWQIQKGYEILAIDSTNLHDFKQGVGGTMIADPPLFDPDVK